MGVRHRGVLAAASVGRRTGIGARALRPDAKGAERIHARDRAAPGPDRQDVDLREGDRVALHLAAKAPLGLAVRHEADVRRGTAHVEGQQVGHSGRGAETGGGDHSGRRAGRDQRDRQPACDVGRREPAVRAHQMQRHAGAKRPETCVELLDVGAHDGQERSVERGRRGARVLPALCGDLARQGNRHTGKQRLEDAPRLPLVLRVREREEKADRDRLDAGAGEGARGSFDVARVERLEHLTFGADPAARLASQLPRHQRVRFRAPQVERAGRCCVPISMTSPKPAVVSRPIRAVRRWTSAFAAIVEPCTR